jgi:aconitate hydratase
VARKARNKGLKVKPWVKTSLAPGSQVVTDYLEAAGLQKDLDKLGFNLVGYGCTTCIGNSGPLPENISQGRRGQATWWRDLGAVGQPQLRRPGEPGRAANYLASPPLVVAYALAGTMNIDLTTDPIARTPTVSRCT